MGGTGQNRAGRGFVTQSRPQACNTHHRGYRCSTRVGRHAAVGLIRIDKPTLASEQGLVFAAGQTDDEIKFISVKVASTAGHAHAVDICATLLRHVGEGRNGEALVVFLQDEVNHTTNSVRAIHGRGAVFQNFNPLHGSHGDLVQVDRTAVQSVGRKAATIEQNQGVIGALTAQISGRKSIATATGACGHVRVACQIIEAITRYAQDAH